jgi:hypothetical protein
MNKLTLNKTEQAFIDLMVNEVIKKLDGRQFKNTVTKAVTDALNKQPVTNVNAYDDPFKDYKFGDNNSEAK